MVYLHDFPQVLISSLVLDAVGLRLAHFLFKLLECGLDDVEALRDTSPLRPHFGHA